MYKENGKNHYPNALFYIPGEASPYHPQFTADVIQQLDGKVEAIPLDAKRTRSNDLLVAVPWKYRDRNAIVMGHFGGVTEEKQLDLLRAFNAVTVDELGVLGDLRAILLHQEGRDDITPRTKGPRGAANLAQDIRLMAASTNGKTSGIVEHEAHSIESIALGEKQFGRRADVLSTTSTLMFARAFDAIPGPKDKKIIISPDLGATPKGVIAARALQVPLVFGIKTRPEVGKAEMDSYFLLQPNNLVIPVPPGFMEGKTGFAVDDRIDSAGTLIENAKNLKQKQGLKNFYFGATHALFAMPDAANNIIPALDDRTLDGLYITDTLASYKNLNHKKITVLPMAPTIAAVIKTMAGAATPQEVSMVNSLVYDTCVSKEQLTKEFAQRKMRFDNLPQKTFGQHGEIFTRNR